MQFKLALILAFLAQLTAAGLALRLNVRYRIYSAWFFVSAALCVSAILRLITLCQNWIDPPTVDENWVEWASAFAALLSSVLVLAGMSFIEPFFKRMAAAQESLQNERRRLATIVDATEEELRLAQRIQKRLLPAEVPPLPTLDIFGQSDAAEWTSGDYYDFLTLSDGSTAMIVADVCGHGLGPALLMSSTRASFRGLASTIDDIAELMIAGNRAVGDAVSSSEFVTAMIVQYDHERRTLKYVGAGHVAYLLNADDSWETLPAEAPPLGILRDLEVSCMRRENIRQGAILVIVTDGILEIENEAGEQFGELRLRETIASYRSEPAKTLVAKLLATSRRFAGKKPHQDDITALIVKFTA
ncbi:MAG: serine/threonine-protein phosphatase [bacterium]|nr:serine/threonine-protein phosphatase [bacterium]